MKSCYRAENRYISKGVSEMSEYAKTGTCAICGKEYSDWGHNPEPILDYMYRVCDDCNKLIIKERIFQSTQKSRR